MWISDDKGTLIRLNQACRDLFRIKDDEVVGKYNAFRDEVMEAQGLLPIIKQVFENGKTTRFCSEYDTSRLKNLDLKEKAFLVLDVTIIPVFDSRGRVTHAIFQHIDITESKRAEELLRESENRYRSIFETTGTATIIVEEDMTISLANAELEKLTGYSRAEIEGKKKWTEFVVKEDLEAMKAYHYARRNASGSAPRSYEFRLLDKQGNVKNVLLTVALVTGTRKTVASILDITERKRMEEALRQSEEKYRLIAENTADIISINDMNLRFTYISPSVMRMRGFTAEEAMKETLDRVMTPESLKIVLKAFEEEMKLEASGTADPNRTRTLELEEYKKGGSIIPVESTLSYLRDKDRKPVGILAITRDITERKQAEDALRKSEESALRLAKENAVMAEIGRIISSTPNIDEVYKLFAEKVKDLLSFDRMVINLVNKDGVSLLERYVKGESVPGRNVGEVFPMTGTLTGKVIQGRKGFLFDSQDENEMAAKYPGLLPEIRAGYRSFLSVPLISGEQPIGGLHFRSKQTGFYSEKDLSLAESIGNQIAGAIANAQLHLERKRAEEGLRESEQKLMAILQGSPIPAFVIGKDHRVMHWNKALKEMSGIDPGEVIGTSRHWKAFYSEKRPCMADLLVDEVVDRIPQWYADKYTTSKFAEGAYEATDFFPTLGEEGKWLRFTAAAIRDPQGNLIGAIETLEDITERRRAEEAVRESEERYRHVVELSPELIAVHSNEKYVYMNPAGVRFLGAKGPEELIGRSIFDIIHPDYRGIVRERMEKTYKEGKDVPLIEERYVCLDGRMIDVEVASAFLNYQGQPAALVVARDITTRKQAEEALRRSEKEAQDLLQETAIMAGIGRIISSSANIDDVYELFAQEAKKIIPFDRITVSIFNLEEMNYFILYTTGIEVPGFHKGDCHPIRTEFLERAGRMRPGVIFQVSAEKEAQGEEEIRRQFPSFLPHYQAGLRSIMRVPLFSKDQPIGSLNFLSREFEAYSESDLRVAEKIANQIAGAVANVQLFRKQKRTEEELFKSNERYQRLVEMSPLMISIQKGGKYVYLNPAALKALGASKPEELVGRSIFEIIHPDYWDAARERFQLAKQGKPVPLIEEKVVRLDKKVIDVELSQIQVFEGDEHAVMVMGRDITGQKKAEREKAVLQEQLQQAQKMEAIGTLAGGIAHDFNNILAGIMGYAELAGLDIPQGSKAQENLQNSIKSANRAKNLVQQILAFSRQSKQERKPMDIGPIIKEGLKLLRASLPSTIEIRQDLKRDLGSIVADPTQIHQVVMNLCTNASHAMSEKGGVLEVSLEKMNMEAGSAAISAGIEAGPYLRLRVSDTGHGIPPEILKRIFDPYFTTKGAGKGTGLGLAVVHGIVKSYGGGISVSSEVGKGSSFDVYFPRVEDSISVLEAGKVEPLPLGGQERVLFVDDEKEIGEIGQKSLQYLGYEVVVRMSSLEALELFRAKADQFDLVITDMTMPNMTGEELAREILGIRPGIPIILCTGFSENMSEGKAKALGIREFVMKPLVIMDLAKAIRRALGSREKKMDRE